jgi:hypothetical protein
VVERRSQMPAQGRLKPFWRWLAVRLAALEVQRIKIDLGFDAIMWDAEIPPKILVDAQEQWKVVLAGGRIDEP